MEIFAMILLSLGLALSLVAFFGVINVFFPQRIVQTRQLVESAPGRSFLVGLVNSAFFLAAAMAVASLGDPFQLVALLLLLPISIGAILGLASLVELIGERLSGGKSGIVGIAWGALSLGLGCALPYVGWFGLFPFVSLLGLGAFILGLFDRQKSERNIAEEVEAMID
jgi:hypothetical protein